MKGGERRNRRSRKEGDKKVGKAGGGK